MHSRSIFVLLLILAGISFAQDTNFSVGPQYLVTASSTMFLRPIATPSLSLSEAPPVAANINTTEAVPVQQAPAAITNETFLSDVYWGDHAPSEVEAYRTATPSLSPSQIETSTIATANEAEEPAAAESLPGMPAQYPASSVIEISVAALPTNLPASIFDTGVTAVTNGASLEQRGYGIPLGQAAAYWKAHKISATKVFTNRDIESLHGS